MLLWINGPFGIGKTSTALTLRDTARNRGVRARIYDPEIFGMILQRFVPRALRPADFREQPSWRVATRVAVEVGTKLPDLSIVPMTIDDPRLLASLVGDR
ncbi:MAG: ATP-binding protein, partial [Myxococcota bacterium]